MLRTKNTRPFNAVEMQYSGYTPEFCAMTRKLTLCAEAARLVCDARMECDTSAAWYINAATELSHQFDNCGVETTDEKEREVIHDLITMYEDRTHHEFAQSYKRCLDQVGEYIEHIREALSAGTFRTEDNAASTEGIVRHFESRLASIKSLVKACSMAFVTYESAEMVQQFARSDWLDVGKNMKDGIPSLISKAVNVMRLNEIALTTAVDEARQHCKAIHGHLITATKCIAAGFHQDGWDYVYLEALGRASANHILENAPKPYFREYLAEAEADLAAHGQGHTSN